MKYLVIDTTGESQRQAENPVNWTIVGAAQTLEEAEAIAFKDAQAAVDGLDEVGERNLAPYLIVEQVAVLAGRVDRAGRVELGVVVERKAS